MSPEKVQPLNVMERMRSPRCCSHLDRRDPCRADQSQRAVQRVRLTASDHAPETRERGRSDRLAPLSAVRPARVPENSVLRSRVRREPAIQGAAERGTSRRRLLSLVTQRRLTST